MDQHQAVSVLDLMRAACCLAEKKAFHLREDDISPCTVLCSQSKVNHIILGGKSTEQNKQVGISDLGGTK